MSVYSGLYPPDIFDVIKDVSGRVESLEKTTGEGVTLDDGTTTSYTVVDAAGSGTVQVYVQTTTPAGLNTSTDVGSHWYNGATHKVWTGLAWVNYTSALSGFYGSPDLVSLALGIIANGLTNYRIYYQAAAPGAPAYGWMWKNSSTNAIQIWDGAAWVNVTDTNTIAGVNDALTGADLTDSHIKVYVQAAAPGGQVAADVGNVWYDSDDNYTRYKWDGTAWVNSSTSIVPTTDGVPPPYSPAPTNVPGIGSLFIKWAAVPNHDPVTYKVYIGTANPVVPSSTTFAGQTTGTLVNLRQLPNGTAFDSTTTYYTAIIAQDADGAAAQSASVAGTVIAQITAPYIATDAVTNVKIFGGSVDTSKLADGSVSALKLLDGAVITSKYGDTSVTAGKVATDALTATQIAADAIAASELAANSVVAGDITTNAVTSGTVTALAIIGGKIAADAVTATEIAVNAITASELAANSVTAADMLANTITATQINTDAITSNELAANAVTASELSAGAVTAVKIAAGAIDATKLTATAIDGMTITGAIVRTASSGARIVLNGASSAIQLYSGVTSETPGVLDPATTSGPNLTLKSPSNTTNPQAPSIYMLAGSGTSSLTVNAEYTTFYNAAGNTERATIGAATFDIRTNLNVNGNVTIVGSLGGGTTVSGTFSATASITCDSNGTGGGFVDGNYVGQTATTASINTNGRIIRTSTRDMKHSLKPMTREEAHSVRGLISYTGKFRKDKYDDFADPVTYPFFVAEQGAECGAELWVSRQHGIERDKKTGKVKKFIRNPQGKPVAFRTAEVTVAHNYLINELFDELEALKQEIAELKK